MGVMTPFVTQVATLGFAIIPAFLGQDDLLTLERSLPHPSAERGGVRNLLDIPAVADLADADQMRSLIDPILGSDAFPVRGILFDKTPATNWRVSWHQDLTIAVTKRVEAPAYGPWSEKDGVVHVQPPAAVLERMVAVRLHLDHSGAENGPLRVLPGSHRAGKLRDAEIPTWRKKIPEVACLIPRGGVLLMRPLLLHASSPAVEPDHRRVIHIEYASSVLAEGLQWRWARRGARAA